MQQEWIHRENSLGFALKRSKNLQVNWKITETSTTHDSHAILLRSEQVARLAVQQNLSSGFGILDGANEILIAAEEVGEDDAKDDGCEAATDETFPGLLWAQLDQWSFTEEEAEHVGHDVVADDHHDGDDEPDHAWKEEID
jgi:hypothetical protein